MIECDFFFVLILIWIVIVTVISKIIEPRKVKLVFMKALY
jgi:hypothetical protein